MNVRALAASSLLGGVMFAASTSEMLAQAAGQPLPLSGVAPAPAKALQLDLGGGVLLDLVLVPAGTFQMGNVIPGEKPIHEVTITRPFFLGKFEVTQAQYQTVMGSNPSHFKGTNLPVESVSWDKAQEFCAKVSARTGRSVQLPTEAQWEYACRAGSKGTYSSGEDLADLKKIAWFSWSGEAQADAPTKPVGSFQPNAFGLYDMHGNVYEWCADWFDPDFYTRSPKEDPVNLIEVIPPGRKEAQPVLRGGSAGSPPGKVRAAYRNNYSRMGKHTIGFRVVVLTEAAAPGSRVSP